MERKEMRKRVWHSFSFPKRSAFSFFFQKHLPQYQCSSAFLMISSSPRIAVLTFPGNNCEQETVRALQKAGLFAEVFLWNMPGEKLEEYSAVVIPGGFSFEDRGKSGVLAAQERIFATLKKMAESGTPVLGICNGAQILVESGLLLTDTKGRPAVALTHNKRKDENGKILGTGYFHSWQIISPCGRETPFTQFSHPLRVPIAHGEGRFLFPPELEKMAEEKNLIVFKYVNEEGISDPHFPVNPNGSFKNSAGICSPSGNVVALMPHPERSEEGMAVFHSLAKFLTEKETNNTIPHNNSAPITFPPRPPKELPRHDCSFFIHLKITDNTEKSFENLLRHQGFSNLSLNRYVRWDFTFATHYTLEEILSLAEKIILSHELVNLNKESVVFVAQKKVFKYEKGSGFGEVCEEFPSKNSFTVQGKEDFFGEAKKEHLAHLFPDFGIDSVSHGVHWEFAGEKAEHFRENPLFASFVSEEVYYA